MKAIPKTAMAFLAGCVLLDLSGCSGMSTRDRNTAAGAAIGGVAGSVLTDHSTLGTLGGAAVGGYIGNQTGRR